MSTARLKLVVPPPLARKLECSACGATTDAACDCGASYTPAGARAAKAVAANPERSDRAIAAELGVAPNMGRDSSATHALVLGFFVALASAQGVHASVESYSHRS